MKNPPINQQKEQNHYNENQEIKGISQHNLKLSLILY